MEEEFNLDQRWRCFYHHQAIKILIVFYTIYVIMYSVLHENERQRSCPVTYSFVT